MRAHTQSICLLLFIHNSSEATANVYRFRYTNKHIHLYVRSEPHWDALKQNAVHSFAFTKWAFCFALELVYNSLEHCRQCFCLNWFWIRILLSGRWFHSMKVSRALCSAIFRISLDFVSFAWFRFVSFASLRFNFEFRVQILIPLFRSYYEFRMFRVSNFENRSKANILLKLLLTTFLQFFQLILLTKCSLIWAIRRKKKYPSQFQMILITCKLRHPFFDCDKMRRS